MSPTRSNAEKTPSRPFSLKIYLLTVFALSWPFQIAFLFLGEEFRPILLGSMIMAGVGTFVAGRYIFKDGFAGAGWRWGKPLHYILVFGLALFLWLVPVVLEYVLGIREFPQDLELLSILGTFLLAFMITLIPAFGEEFSWRGYLLPRLLARYSSRRALILHGVITWVWHLPFVVVIGLQLGGNPIASIPLALTVSLIPTVMHAVVFAYIWSTTQSLAVATVYHSAFDEVRDTLEGAIGFGLLAENWQMVVLTILGAMLLWKGKWRKHLVFPTPAASDLSQLRNAERGANARSTAYPHNPDDEA
jgi:membrane protease YdiL (CAAX protease family)